MTKTTGKDLCFARISMIQPALIWEDIEANLNEFTKVIEGIPEESDLIILPETFSTGFTMKADRFSEGEDGVALEWMQEVAHKKQAYITGSLIIRQEGRIFNRLYWISPGGIEGRYDKRHLFRMGQEEQYFQPGDSRQVFTLGEFRFMPQICYDIRFPVFARNRNDYDILFYVANWPASRQIVWETLLKARAMENQAYVLGVNRTGTDGEGVEHEGGTCAIGPMGNTIQTLDDQPGVLNVSIDLNEIREFRKKFPAWKDADNFTL
ncbi:MAG: amidohydrolase [Bacteroidales bacterium]|nr:amidohydrolase [Bacteroidales bacterium]